MDEGKIEFIREHLAFGACGTLQPDAKSSLTIATEFNSVIIFTHAFFFFQNTYTLKSLSLETKKVLEYISQHDV